MASKSKAKDNPPPRRQLSRGFVSPAAKAREDAVKDALPTSGIKLAPTTRRTSIQRTSNDRTLAHAQTPSVPTVSEGSSGGRSGGRQQNYTVANVGINGRIYLRPIVRPASERQQPPSFVFPSTPAPVPAPPAPIPSTREQSYFDIKPSRPGAQRDSVWSGTLPSTQRLRKSGESFAKATNSIHASRLQRAHSFSTVEEYNTTKDKEETNRRGGRPRPRRPKSADASLPTFLKVEIPHYRLGTPRFSTFGTAFIRSSAYTHNSSTDDLPSSIFAPSEAGNLFPIPPGVETHDFVSNWNSNAQAVATGQDVPRPPSPPLRRSLEPIRPTLFDQLTFPPGSDDPRVVRYSPETGQIIAATTPRIIAQITSANFLDYELLSDFFLTYRAFMRADDLVGFLLTRLQWAIYHGGDTGSIVRVRAFVAIRHWILNYFVDDFVPNIELRRLFCDMLNALTESVKRRTNPAANDLNLIGEVKKCWRRTCALYWDGPHFIGDGRSDETLCPGGFPGTRTDGCHPSTNHLSDSIDGDNLAPLFRVPVSEYEGGSLMQEVTRASHIFSNPQIRVPVTGEPTDQQPSSTLHQRRVSPTSDVSVPAMSCSLPATTLLRPAPPLDPVLSARPVEIRDLDRAGNDAPKSTLPAASKPGLSPGILRTPTPSGLPQPELPQTALPFAGSLVRGTVLHPREAYVETIAPRTPSESIRTPNMRSARAYNAVVANQQRSAGAMQPSVKKFLENLRRVFSSRMIDTQESLATAARAEQANKRSPAVVLPSNQLNIHPAHRQKPSIRIDLLGATVVELFNETMKATYGVRDGPGYASGGSDEEEAPKDHSHLPTARQGVQSQMTNGSDSIVIVDDTDPLMSAVMSSSLGGQVSNAAVESTSPVSPDEALRRARLSLFPLKDEVKEYPPSSQHQIVPLIAEADVINAKEAEKSKLAESARLRSSALPRGPSFTSSRTHSLRKYASFQSGLAKFVESGASERDVQIILEEGLPSLGRSLKRRPGGDLKTVDLVKDLEYAKRPRSVGSLTTGYSESILSMHVRQSEARGATGVTDFAEPPRQTLSLSAFGQNPSKGASVHAGQSGPAVLRPSFEAEVAKLAEIPDDDNDDGGVESTLAKLEGKFEKRNSESSIGLTESLSDISFELKHGDSDDASDVGSLGKRNRHQRVMESVLSAVPQPLQLGAKSNTSTAAGKRPALPEDFPSGSEESNSSIPLLDREFSDESNSDRHTSPDRGSQILGAKTFAAKLPTYEDDLESHPSIVQAEEPESVRELRERSVASFPKDKVTDSFLLDEDEDFSDLSSELSDDDEISQTDITSPKSTAFAKSIDGNTHHPSELAFAAHPLRHPPSPPTAIDKVTAYQPTTTAKQEPAPKTEVAVSQSIASHESDHSKQLSNVSAVKPTKISEARKSKSNTAHLPFILAHDSQTIAQQLTLVEKDALNEIDWRELVELRWKQNPPNVHNWVEYLRDNQPKGLELVVTRFNLVVKWAVSEIVLTANMQERANTIVKYIHIAAHTRRLRNYSSMYQISIALISSDVSRLTQSWALVPKEDKQTLRELEQLVSPTHNFHNLRLEMESVTADDGCIPFIGIYTHDLVFNAQRPAQITVSLKTEPLINFERFRTAASIVKELLRLLEASTKYNFAPVEGVLEKCLWIAALPEHEIRAYGKELK
ncbi:MAG: Guanine nucleotide exchange factor lte1 [Vezdaea aestivalis]|nr:MAG: Guanine nucleotide exchange factor lte1 [Vezdaea aestivalis]